MKDDVPQTLVVSLFLSLVSLTAGICRRNTRLVIIMSATSFQMYREAVSKTYVTLYFPEPRGYLVGERYPPGHLRI